MGNRLLSADSLRKGLHELLEGAAKWEIFIERPRMDWRKGELQEPNLIISKGDDFDISTELDERLVKSKWVELVLSWDDSGAVLLDLTRRQHRSINRSPEINDRMKVFYKAIHERAATRFLSPTAAVFALAWPFTWFIPIFLVTSLVDPTMRHYYYSGTPAVPPGPSGPQWLSTCAGVCWYTWPAGLFVAALIGYIRLKSGGLGLRTPVVNQTVWLAFFYRVRREGLRTETWRQIVVAVITTVITALITLLIVGK